MSGNSITLILLVLLLAGIAVATVWLYVYWWLMQRPNPRINGELKAPFLAATATVRRDKHGVPHITAANEADLFRIQGWTHAQDRMWQMEQTRRTASGRLAEIFGAPALEADRFCRIVGYRRAAEAELATLDPDTLQILNWYTEGINAYINAHPGRLAAELNLLRVRVEPWTVIDTLASAKSLAWAQSINWESELARLQLGIGLDPYTASDLEPDYPPGNPLLTEAVGSETKTRLLHTAGLLLNQYEQVRTWLGGAAGQGSNSWVVAPKHSLNRRALLCADPHLNVQMPAPLYEMHISCPTLEASGATQPGLPGFTMGHNNLIAWGAANALVDTQDLFIEQPHPDNPGLFLYAGNWEQATIIEEPITVRRGGTYIERIVVTRHGPLLTGFLDTVLKGTSRPASAATIPISLKWSGIAPGNQISARIALLRAQDWESFTAALQDWVTPVQTFTYADARGNIGCILAGRIPIRTQHLGLVPAPGWEAAFDWAGNIPQEDLPRIYNPSSGLIVAANQKIVGDDYPYFLGVEFDPGWRAARIEEMLLEKERHTIRDMQEIQQDNQSKFAQTFTPWFTLLRSEDPWEKTAIQLLRKWNWRMDSDSSGALCFHYMLGNLLEMVFGDKLGGARDGYFGVSIAPLVAQHGLRLRAETRLLQLINEHDESIWFTDAASGRRRTRDEILQEALTTAMKSIRQIHGDSSLRWAWGRSHQIRFPHPLGRARLVGGFFDRGPLPIGGDGTTPNQTRSRTAMPSGLVQVLPAYRQVYEIGAWDRAETVIAGGQSGHPLSRLYDDQIMMWREGVYHAMPWSDEAIDKITEYKLTLTPA